MRVPPSATEVTEIILLLLLDVESSVAISNGPPATVHRYSSLMGDKDAGGVSATTGATGESVFGVGVSVVSGCTWTVGAVVVTGILVEENELLADGALVMSEGGCGAIVGNAVDSIGVPIVVVIESAVYIKVWLLLPLKPITSVSTPSLDVKASDA